MPKCSGPTCWTRGCRTPPGLATVAEARRAAGRLRERVVDMGPASGKGIGLIPFSQLALQNEFFFTKTHIPGDWTWGPGDSVNSYWNSRCPLIRPLIRLSL